MNAPLLSPSSSFKADATLGDVQAYLRENAARGTDCPCCGGFVKVYKRRLHEEMARFLLKLIRVHGQTGTWVHARDILGVGAKTPKAGSDGAYLVHWGLVERHPRVSGAQWSGFYRPTPLGIAFVRNPTATVAKHVHLLNNRPVGWSGKTTFREALGVDFDYQEVMGKSKRNGNAD